MDKNNSWKQKSAALTLAVSMVMVNPIALSGCSSSNNAQIKNSANQSQNIAKDKDKDKEDEEQQSGSSGSYSGGGGGHSSSPFRFNSSSGSSSNNSSVSSESSSGWHAWTTPSSSGGYSGVHAGSVAG